MVPSNYFRLIGQLHHLADPDSQSHNCGEGHSSPPLGPLSYSERSFGDLFKTPRVVLKPHIDNSPVSQSQNWSWSLRTTHREEGRLLTSSRPLKSFGNLTQTMAPLDDLKIDHFRGLASRHYWYSAAALFWKQHSAAAPTLVLRRPGSSLFPETQ